MGPPLVTGRPARCHYQRLWFLGSPALHGATCPVRFAEALRP